MLGISVNTLRRRITEGQVRGERVRRPQGYVWRVYLDDEHPPEQEAPSRLQQPATPLAQAEALATLIQATLTPIIAPLVAEQAALRQTVERQAGEVADLREERGRLTAELEAERSARQQLLTERDAAERSRRREARRMALALAVVATLALAAAATPAWVR